MIGPVSSATQQATLNPFQKQVDDQVRESAEQKPQENTVQRADAPTNEIQRTETRPQEDQRQTLAANSSQDTAEASDSTERGSLVDISV